MAGGAGTNQLAWEAPDHGGAYTVKVTAKRHCGGAGGGDDGAAVEEDFEVTGPGS